MSKYFTWLLYLGGCALPSREEHFKILGENFLGNTIGFNIQQTIPMYYVPYKDGLVIKYQELYRIYIKLELKSVLLIF